MLTDSGGTQEEVPTLKKLLLVMREITKGTEDIETDDTQNLWGQLGGIVDFGEESLFDEAAYVAMSNVKNPLEMGGSLTREKNILMRYFSCFVLVYYY